MGAGAQLHAFYRQVAESGTLWVILNANGSWASWKRDDGLVSLSIWSSDTLGETHLEGSSQLCGSGASCNRVRSLSSGLDETSRQDDCWPRHQLGRQGHFRARDARRTSIRSRRCPSCQTPLTRGLTVRSTGSAD